MARLGRRHLPPPIVIAPPTFITTAAPPAPGLSTQVEPMRAIRLTADYGGAEYLLFTGFVDTWGITYSWPAYGEAAVQASDYFKVLAKLDRVAATAATGDGETTSQRLGRILDVADYRGARDLSAGGVQMQGTVLEGNALNEMQEAAEAEAGDLWVEGDGALTFRTRVDAVSQPAQAVSQATFGDTSGGDDLPVFDVQVAYDEQTLVNIAQVAMSGDGSPVHEVRDEASITKYLPASYVRTSLPFYSDADALAYAQMIVDRLSVPELQITQLTLRPRRDPARLFPQALGRRIGDRITVVLHPPGGGTSIDRECVIRGIQHTVDAWGDWLTVWTLGTAQPVAYLILDSASLGLLDTARIY
jgi:hypothetical protein